METKHGNQVINESLQVDFLAFEGVNSGDVVVGEEVDSERLLEEGQHALVDIEV